MVLVLGVGRCAFRPPRVVFVLGLGSLINSLTSGKKRKKKKAQAPVAAQQAGRGAPAKYGEGGCKPRSACRVCLLPGVSTHAPSRFSRACP